MLPGVRIGGRLTLPTLERPTTAATSEEMLLGSFAVELGVK